MVAPELSQDRWDLVARGHGGEDVPIFFFLIELTCGTQSTSPNYATSALTCGSCLSDSLSIRVQSTFSVFCKKSLAKSGGFFSRKRKVVVYGKFQHQSGGFMLLTRREEVLLPVWRRLRRGF
jgi:hypothetical protein